MKTVKIAIDGPAGAGKSTIAKLIAERLDIIYIDTGAMYRAIALKCLDIDIDFNDREGISKLLETTHIDIVFKCDVQRLMLDGVDVSDRLRTVEVSNAASYVATLPEVREKLVNIQRQIAKGESVVMDGRDIGTYVLPDAEVKFFLTASLEERARRRYIEYRATGEDRSLDDIIKEIDARDRADSTRKFAPLTRADDAILVDTTDKNIEEVVEIILEIIEDKTSIG